MKIPLVDLHAQHNAMQAEIAAAMSSVMADSAFVGNPANPYVRAFEEQFAAFTQTAHCVACGNGTDSLEILLAAAGVGRGDEVLVPAVSWIATSEAVTTCGATPVFVDVLRDEYTMDPACAESKLTSRTVAIIPVHLYGAPARMSELCAFAQRHNLFLLEDCAQAHGATYQGRQVGLFGHAASYSFFPSKNLGALGDAGAMTTNDAALARRARMIAQHGQSEYKHDHQIEGRNSRMDGLQAAVLSAKLRHLPAWTSARKTLSRRYRLNLEGLVDGMQSLPEGSDSVFHLFVIELTERSAAAEALAKAGISTAVQYPAPLPLLRAYEHLGFSVADFPNAAAMTSRILSLPLYPELAVAQQDYVISNLAALRRR